MAGNPSTSRPAKRAKLLSDNEASSSEDEGGRKAGVALPSQSDEAQNGFKINAEYAKRFEHNKKREERHRLEEKFGSGKSKGQNGTGKGGASDEEDEEDSEDQESEDDDAELATEQLDAEIMDTLQAIRRKDPRVYDNSVKFYREFDPETEGAKKEKKEKPMYLQDYHRANLLAGAAEDEAEAETQQPPRTFAQEQEDMRKELVGGMHAAAKDEQKEDGVAAGEDDEEDEDDFLVAKSKPQHDSLPATTTASFSDAPQQPKQNKRKRLTDADIATAEKDPETYLSNFMAARAWLPSDGARWQAFDSDDSDDDRRADEFEEAYNMRFEDPSKSNEKLASFARDVGKYGVRREEKSGRAKARERERERKEAEKREREEEKARLRKLKIEEAEEKVNRIRDAAGLRGKDVDLDQWKDIIEGDFDDAQWDQEMQRRFGDQYYAQDEEGDGSDVEMEDVEGGGGKKKAKKPKWDDDIDIHDLVPDFKDKDENPNISLSDDEADGNAEGGAPLPADEEEDDDDDEGSTSKKKKKTKKDRQQEKASAKRAARKQRAQIEEIVDASLPLQHPSLSTTSTNNKKTPTTTGFRYRATSPTSFGLSARDILFADDKQLNDFAGLKKFHSFREEEKKRRDRKKFSKKARLRQWRRDTFGDVEEPKGGFERVLGAGDGGMGKGGADGVGGGKGGKKGKGSLREDAEMVKAEQDGGMGEEGDVREGERRKKRRSGKGKKGKSGEV
ncbi:hypothetical protein D0867_16024 [Hortaea werneckii]|uniref:Kri1-like C-terminal domain-containing protein n=1 Tax=Hortaea werneckii TaxID=91943 RepID=A0A3M6YHB3_HORWE|nr:hypothetical protein D0867_16024 [Hortaea werneckii]RMY02171.1 hypothetical protein D0866_15682 [Hortaea werneckii]